METEKRCLELFARDYIFSVVNNENGDLCDNYPSQIVILENEHHGNNTSPSSFDGNFNVTQLRDAFTKARVARCRARFPIPVILYDGKHICRSSTLSGCAEMYGRSGYDLLFSGGETFSKDQSDQDGIAEQPSDWQLFDRFRKQDIKLLKMFSIRNICDLMVEKKKVKFGVNVTSSEKVDKVGRYSEFTIINLPYPGCEFFRVYKDCAYNAEGLIFDWTQTHIDANIVIPNDPISTQLDIDWTQYKCWDLIRLTQNYFQLILRYLTEGSAGILIHCVSGWDRTPLFISLLRLSLWADRKIHSSLSALEILHLTLAYDWFLCGHNFIDRINRGEEILFFCFNFLKYIESEEYSCIRKARTSSDNSNKSKNSEIVADAILLDGERRNSVCGSNTSLSSNCSSLSYKSHDNPPSLFTNTDDPSEENHNLVSMEKNGHRCSPAFCMDGNSPRGNYSMTIPVAVPAKVRRRSDSGSSASCGSWQIVTGTGSVRGTTNSDLWPASGSDASPISRHSQASLSNIMENESSVASTTTVIHVTRRDRLQAVRSAFCGQYFSVLSGQNKAEGGKLSSFFDQFAEKVGIRSGQSRPP